jgi:hypothetical protein
MSDSEETMQQIIDRMMDTPVEGFGAEHEEFLQWTYGTSVMETF